MAGLEDCESLFTHLERKKILAEEFPVRRSVAIQRALETKELGNVLWLPGFENPAGGLTNTESDMAPLRSLLGSGMYNRGILRPLNSVASGGN